MHHRTTHCRFVLRSPHVNQGEPHARQAHAITGPGAERRPAPRSAGTPRGPGGARPAGPHRPADQQGHRAAPAGALAVHRRRARGQAARVPVHQRGRRKRRPLRHASGSGRACGLARDLRAGHGTAGRRDRPRLDEGYRAADCAGRRDVTTLPGGGRHRRRVGRSRRRLGAAAGADLHAWLRCRALPHGDPVHHARSRERHPEHGHLPGGAEGDRSARRAHGGARGDRRRRLPALAQVPQAAREDADRDRGRLRAHRHVHRPAKTRGRHGRDGRGRRRGRVRRSAWRNAPAWTCMYPRTPRS